MNIHHAEITTVCTNIIHQWVSLLKTVYDKHSYILEIYVSYNYNAVGRQGMQIVGGVHKLLKTYAKQR